MRTATLAANHDVTESWPDFYVLAEKGDWLFFPWEDESEFPEYDLHLPIPVEDKEAAPSHAL